MRGTLSPLMQYSYASGYDSSKRYRRITATRQVVGSASVATKIWEWQWRWDDSAWGASVDGWAYGTFEYIQDTDPDNVMGAFSALTIHHTSTTYTTTQAVTSYFNSSNNEIATDTVTVSDEDSLSALVTRLDSDLQAHIDDAFAPDDDTDLDRFVRATWDTATGTYSFATDGNPGEVFAWRLDLEITNTSNSGTGVTAWPPGDTFTWDPNGSMTDPATPWVVELLRCKIFLGSAEYCRLERKLPFSVWVDPPGEYQENTKTCTNPLTADTSEWIAPLPPWQGYVYLHSAEVETDFPSWYVGGVPVPWTHWLGGTDYGYYDCLCGETPM